MWGPPYPWQGLSDVAVIMVKAENVFSQMNVFIKVLFCYNGGTKKTVDLSALIYEFLHVAWTFLEKAAVYAIQKQYVAAFCNIKIVIRGSKLW